MDNYKEMIGKKIIHIEVDGYGVSITLDNGTEFIYNASDGGYSSWEIFESEVI